MGNRPVPLKGWTKSSLAAAPMAGSSEYPCRSDDRWCQSAVCQRQNTDGAQPLFLGAWRAEPRSEDRGFLVTQDVTRRTMPPCLAAHHGIYVIDSIGGAKGSRTPDLLNAIQALYQLSYGPTGGLLRLSTLRGGSIGARAARRKRKMRCSEGESERSESKRLDRGNRLSGPVVAAGRTRDAVAEMVGGEGLPTRQSSR